MRQTLFALFVAAGVSGFAQQSVLDSRHVVWAGVSCLAYPIGVPDSVTWAAGFYAADPVKIAADRYPAFHPERFLTSKLFADVLNGHLAAFALAPEQPQQSIWDSLAANHQRVLGPATWRPAHAPASSNNDAAIIDRLAASVRQHRFKTLYYYDKRRKCLEARVEGIVLDLAGPQAMTVWIPFQAPPGKKFSRNVNRPDYTWIFDLTRMVNFESEVVTLKGTPETLFREWLWRPLERRRKKAYSLREDALERKQAVKFKEFWKQYGERRDTVVVTDPDTFEERVVVRDRSVRREDIRRASLQQRFYYDERRKAIYVEARIASPAVPRYDAAGNFRYDLPLLHVVLAR